MNKIYFSFLVIFFSSCFPRINYIGNSFPPTKDPDFYVDEKSIDKPYRVIGKGYPDATGSLALKTLQKKAIEKAKKKGADAVLVLDYIGQVASANRSTVYQGKGIIGFDYETQFVILFLKYTSE
jgi:hypothetical protein